VPVPDTPAGGEDERVFGVRDLRGRFPFDGEELAEAIGVGELLLMEDRGSRVFRGRAGPVECFGAVEPCVVHSGVGRGKFRHLGKDILGRLPGELLGVAHLSGDIGHDLPVKSGLARRVDGLSPHLDPALGAGLGPVLLCVTAAREHDVSEFRGLVQEDVLDDQELEVLECLLDMVEVRVRDHRVLAHDVHALEFAGLVSEHVHHGRHLIPVLALGDPVRESPGVGKLLVGSRVDDLLVCREHYRQCTHVAGALDIVLATERVDPASRPAEVAGQHLDVGA